MNTGQYISLVGHTGLIGWLLFGGLINSEPLPFEISEIAVVSEEAYQAALRANDAPSVETNVDALTQPEPDTPSETIIPEPQTETSSETPSVSQPVQDSPPTVDTSDTAPTEIPVEEAPAEIIPPVEEVASLVPRSSLRPKTRPIERIAPTPAAEPQNPQADPSETVEVDRIADAPTETPAEETTATAPEEAVAEIDPEARDEVSTAPSSSVRPKPRPQEAAQAETSDAVSSALQEALGSESNSQTDDAAPTGPPLSAAEREGLKLAVSRCWNLGALSSEAMRVTITVGLDMTRDGKPVLSSIRLINSTGGTDSAAKQAYEAARRAIIRCGANGYDLPSEKFDQWRKVEMKFNPESMR